LSLVHPGPKFETAMIYSIWSLSTLAFGSITIFTGLSLKNLEKHQSALVGCAILLLPICILWPATMPFAIWALVILKHPSAKTHFTDVPLSECRAWIAPRDLAFRWWSRGCEWFQFVWPKIRVAISKVSESARRAFQKAVAFLRSKIVISSLIFLGLAYLWTCWIAGLQIAMVVAEGSIRPGIVRGGFELSQFDPTQVPLPLAMTGVCLILGWIVLWRHSARVFRSSGSLCRADRLTTLREALLGMAGTSFLIAVAMTIMSVISRSPSRPPGQWRWGLDDWDWRFLLVMVQLGFDLLIGLSLALMCWTSRTRLTCWVLFLSTIAYPLLLATCLLERATRGYWTALVPIWSCVPIGLWAILVTRQKPRSIESMSAVPDEIITTVAST
jgi:hypothetical protein